MDFVTTMKTHWVLWVCEELLTCLRVSLLLEKGHAAKILISEGVSYIVIYLVSYLVFCLVYQVIR
jgi:hypothetical protein